MGVLVLPSLIVTSQQNEFFLDPLGKMTGRRTYFNSAGKTGGDARNVRGRPRLRLPDYMESEE